jgi:hypothetical protein
MKNKIATHFYVREEKKDKKGEVPIYLRITVNGVRVGISSDRRVNLDLWDKASERVEGRSANCFHYFIMNWLFCPVSPQNLTKSSF